MVVGIAVGCIAAGLSGRSIFTASGDTLFRLPTLFPFGFQFNSAIFLPVAPVSLVCILEAVGDLTANSLISQQSVDDRAFRNRLKGGIPRMASAVWWRPCSVLFRTPPSRRTTA